MVRSIVILQAPGSAFAERVARAFDGDATIRSLDAPLDASAVTVDSGTVTWEGVDLSAARAVLVERPVFPWPQTPAARTRECRSLALSAILAASATATVINRPDVAGHLAASPAIALARLAQAGLPVHPWELAPAPATSDDALVLDAAGADRWHVPERPPEGQPALLPALPIDALWSLVVVGERVSGAARSDAVEACFAGPSADDAMPLAEVPPPVADVAIRAAAALSLDFAVVTTTEAAHVVHADAGPDLARWDDVSRGQLATDFAEHLFHLSSPEESPA